MIQRKISYGKILEYFKNLADKHVDIQKFIGFSPTEFQIEENKMKPEGYPALVLFNYEGKLDGNNQRTLSIRTISFAIVKVVTKHDDFTRQYEAITDCEQIGFSVLSRIRVDNMQETIPWLYKNFVKESVTFNEIRLKTPSGLFGMEFSFDLNIPDPLSIDSDDWEDIDSVC